MADPVTPTQLEQLQALADRVARELDVPRPTVLVDLPGLDPQGRARRTRRRRPRVHLTPAVTTDPEFTAWLIPHEVGHIHVDRQHRGRTWRFALLKAGLWVLIIALLGLALAAALYGIGAQFALAAAAAAGVVVATGLMGVDLAVNGWDSRRCEHGADVVAAAALTRLGHDGVAMTRSALTRPFITGKHVGGWFASHPSPAERIAHVEAALQHPTQRAPVARNVRWDQQS